MQPSLPRWCLEPSYTSPTTLGVRILLPRRPSVQAVVSAWEGSSHLAGVLASLEEASANHAVCDLAGVGGFALGLTQERGVQTL